MAAPPKKKKNPELERFGKKLSRQRYAQGLTQEKLAERCDLSTRAVQKIEAGELNILLTTLKRLRRALRCSWQRLLD